MPPTPAAATRATILDDSRLGNHFRVAATVPSPLLCTTVLIVSKGWPTATVVMP